jgi:hypothetical protein
LSRLSLLSLTLAMIALVAVVGASAGEPENTSPPAVGGTAREDSTLTASSGTWSNLPTSYAFHWQRCANRRAAACADIPGATRNVYTLVAADVGHAVRVVVTAANEDGKSSAFSVASDVVAEDGGPGRGWPFVGLAPRRQIRSPERK